jgi:hypothetical protein
MISYWGERGRNREPDESSMLMGGPGIWCDQTAVHEVTSDEGTYAYNTATLEGNLVDGNAAAAIHGTNPDPSPGISGEKRY